VSFIFKNNANSRLKIVTGAASITLTVEAGDGAKFPQPVGDGSDFFSVTVEDRRTEQMEIMLCTARSGDILTVTRAQEGTVAQDFLVGATVSSRPTAGLWQQIFGYGWSKSEADARFVNVAGDTMTGPLTLPGDPVDPNHATNKSWVETLVGSVTSLTEAPTDGQAYVRQSANWSVGATKAYVDSQDAGLNSLIGGLDGDFTALQAELDALELVVADKLDDAPSDGLLYGRQDAAWAQAVTQGEFDTYVTNTNAALGTKIGDAPNDANAYVRSGAAWALGVLKSTYDAFVAATNAALALRLTDAPNDANIYGRSGAAWLASVTKAAYDAFVAATNAALALRAPLASPALTGNPTAPTPTAGDNDTSIATTAFVIAAIAAAGAAGVPAGACISVPATTPPTGYLKRNGALLNRTTYSALWAYAQASGNLVANDAAWTGNEGAFSPGDGATTFRIPDGRGTFDRNWDDSRGVDAGRALGSAQGDAYLNHSHTANALGGHYHTVATSTTYANGLVGINSVTQLNAGANGQITGTSTRYTESVSAGTPVINASTTGGTETRPKSTALLACIKY
jgi:hypothetical protein